MRVQRVKVVLLNEDGSIRKMRTAFEHNAFDVAAAYVKEAGAGYVSRIDPDGDHVVYFQPEVDASAAEQLGAAAEQIGAARAAAARAARGRRPGR